MDGWTNEQANNMDRCMAISMDRLTATYSSSLTILSTGQRHMKPSVVSWHIAEPSQGELEHPSTVSVSHCASSNPTVKTIFRVAV